MLFVYYMWTDNKDAILYELAARILMQSDISGARSWAKFELNVL